MQDASKAPGRRAGFFTRTALLAATAIFMVPAMSSAQVLDPLRGYGFDGSPIGGQGPAPRGRASPARDDSPVVERRQRQTAAYVSPNRIRMMAARDGFRLATMPRRHGRAYMALAENNSGHRFELMFDAASGDMVGQRDLGPIAVAKAQPPVSTPADQPAQAAVAQPAAPAAAAMPAPSNEEIATARAEVEKAAAAEADAKHTAEARAAETRRAQTKLAEAEAGARRLAEAQAQEARRQDAIAAEQKRNELRMAEMKRRALATAEAKLSQAKALQARADAEMKRAETEAANARAAIAPPAEMAKDVAKPDTMAPVAKAAGIAAEPDRVEAAKLEAAKAEPAKTDVVPAADVKDASKSNETSPSQIDAMKGPGADAATGQKAAPTETTAVAKSVEPGASQPSPAQPALAADAPKQAAAAETTDPAPTGSLKQSPPEPYTGSAPATSGPATSAQDKD